MAQNLTSPWVTRITTANTRYNEWANKYRCNDLEQYYRGFQWNMSKATDKSLLPYTLNMIYSTVKIKLANYLVYTPRVIIAPKPGDAAFEIERAIASSQVKEAVANTLLVDNEANFSVAIEKAARDSFFRLGLIEVGYSASFIENPNVDKPEFASDKNPEISKDRITTAPRETIESERIYFKYINPRRFRVGDIGEGDTLDTSSWYGYYDYVYVKDLAAALKIKVDNLKSSLASGAASSAGENEVDELVKDQDELVKIWHIWDNRSRQRYIITDTDGEIRFKKPFERKCVFDLRWDMDFEGFYPIPPTFQWISPQDEINESREQARNHRRRFTRKFQCIENGVTVEEVDKFNYGPDGTLIFTKREDAIRAISSPDLGKASDQMLVIPKDDFNLISATSQEARGMGDRVTATQANIIESRSNIREGAEVERINSWLAKIVREALLLARDRFTQPMQTESPQDMQSQMLMDYNTQRTYAQVFPDQLDDGYDFVVLIDVASTSPNQNQLEKQKFLEFITVMQQFPQLAMSPLLIREAAYRIGYRNERVIREMQQSALLQMIGQAQQLGMMEPGGQAQRMNEQMTPPDPSEIQNQLDNQMVQ